MRRPSAGGRQLEIRTIDEELTDKPDGGLDPETPETAGVRTGQLTLP